MKKAIFKYLLFLLVFVLNGFNQAQADVISLDESSLYTNYCHANQVISGNPLNISYASTDGVLDLKVTEIEIEESEESISKKVVQDKGFNVFYLTAERLFKISNKSLISAGLFCNTLFSKRHILFQVFRI
ncbi:hypothetical protein [Aestuariibaculum sediminum]|uniref:Uncharacterized protein n=1 Tax=Aestuariibaculum sediminum TaxID=2770637 RepID=A0A8J6QBH7_9FLAO|nr:hypothetical protein [Aestuariibaculum sediminum]MBD0832971.1 hypothetical protein [Aestuariibaculum sediminum]